MFRVLTYGPRSTRLLIEKSSFLSQGAREKWGTRMLLVEL